MKESSIVIKVDNNNEMRIDNTQAVSSPERLLAYYKAIKEKKED